MSDPIDDRGPIPPSGPATPDTVTRDLETAIAVEIRRLTELFETRDGRGTRAAVVEVIRELRKIR